MLKFLKIREEHLALIRTWRTSPDVTRYMFTDIDGTMETQKAWYRRIQADETVRHWIISYQEKKIGLIYLTDIDVDARQCTWGFYIGDAASRMLGGLIPPCLFNHVFYDLGFRKIVAEIMDENKNAIRLNELFGFKPIARHKHPIHKYGRDHDVFVYELTENTWDPSGRYRNCTAEFE